MLPKSRRFRPHSCCSKIGYLFGFSSTDGSSLLAFSIRNNPPKRMSSSSLHILNHWLESFGKTIEGLVSFSIDSLSRPLFFDFRSIIWRASALPIQLSKWSLWMSNTRGLQVPHSTSKWIFHRKRPSINCWRLSGCCELLFVFIFVSTAWALSASIDALKMSLASSLNSTIGFLPSWWEHSSQ